MSSVLRGFFIARRQVEPNVLSQLAEQTVRIGIVWAALERADALGWDVGGRCTAVLGATAVSEAVSTGLMALFTVKRPAAASVRGLPAARRSRESASGTFSGRWRRTLSRQRSPHRGEYAGADLPGSLFAVFRRAC